MTTLDLEMLRELMDSAAQRGLLLIRANWEGFSVEFAASEPEPKADTRYFTPVTPAADPTLYKDPAPVPSPYASLFGNKPPAFARKVD